MTTAELQDIPEDEVGALVQQLVDSGGVTQITCTPQVNGKWTVGAITN